MTRHSIIVLASALAAGSASAQSLSDRIARLNDGRISFEYATREGVCGDGKNIVGVRRTLLIYPDIESHGRWSGVNCTAGEARVSMTVRDGVVTELRVRVGRDPASGGGTDLGRVPAREVSDAMLAVAERSERRVRRDAMLAAVIADSSDIVPRLLSIARDRSRDSEMRKLVLRWVMAFGGESAVGPLTAIASDEGEPRQLRETAVMALAQLPGGEGVATVTRMAQDGRDPETQKTAVFWLGHADSPAARRVVREIAANDDATVKVRETAIFALGHFDATPDDVAFLRTLYDRIDDHRLRNHIIQSVSQSEQSDGIDWLAALAARASEPVEMRKQALFWLGQCDEFSLQRLVGLYPKLEDRELRKHFVFVLSQRDEREATDALVRIAKEDPDREVRKQALFWLGHRDDAGARKALQEIIDP